MPLQRLFIGTFHADSTVDGIHTAMFNTGDGTISELESAAPNATKPSYLYQHPSKRVLYTVSEQTDRDGEVAAYSVDEAGILTFINAQSSHGTSPCHLMMDSGGNYLFTCNYSSGTVALYPIQAHGGISEASGVYKHEGSSVHERQDASHTHSLTLSKNEAQAFVADLGTDFFYVYDFNRLTGTLTLDEDDSVHVAPGAGPRFSAWHPNGRYVYLLTELSSYLHVFRYDDGLQQIQHVPLLPTDFAGESTGAHVVVSPDGNYVYASNRGHDSIAAFRVNPDDGTLTLIGHTATQGKTPRHFTLVEYGRWLIAANQDSRNLVVFPVENGVVGDAVVRIETPAPPMFVLPWRA